VLTLFFRALYGPGARIYDRFTRIAFAGEWKRWQAASIPWLPGNGVVVELGSGTGTFAGEAAADAAAWIGLDISHEMIRTAKHHHKPLRPAFVRASADAIPLRTGFADAIVATFPTPFIFDPSAAFEMRRVLKQNGRLVAVLSGELNPVGLRRRCIRAVTAFLPRAPARDAPWTPEFVGFEGIVEWQPTRFGRALVYVGRRL
jgi:ubiquinone/menaquinone biosynthesis C-methylase UbiE